MLLGRVAGGAAFGVYDSRARETLERVRIGGPCGPLILPSLRVSPPVLYALAMGALAYSPQAVPPLPVP